MQILIGNFLTGIAIILRYSLDIYMYIIIARAVLSWVNPDPYNQIVIFINKLTDPLLNRQTHRSAPKQNKKDVTRELRRNRYLSYSCHICDRLYPEFYRKHVV